jgi:RNA polymerase sigma factor for flagellar operon FliA
MTGKKTTSKKTASKERAVKKTATRRTASAKPAAVPIEEMQTEDLWGVYRNIVRGGKKAELEHIRNVLMERHYPLVKYIAERLLQTLPKSIELDDLISAGLFGLMDAIRGFDPGRGIKFKTYCTTRIRGSILDQLRSQDWVPRLVRLKAGKIDKALQRLTGEYGREPTHAELAQTLDMDHGELSREIQNASAKAMYSLSDKWEDRDDDSSMEKVDVLEDKKSCDPISELHKNDMMNFITRSLTHKERFIIEQYYQVGHTMREIGEMLALTESRVCQIHSNVMGRLKSLFGSKTTTLLM